MSNDNLGEEKDGFFKRRGKSIKKGFQDNINYEELKSTTGLIKDMAGQAFSPRQQIENAKIENFEAAIKARGLTDFDLISIHKNYTIICYVSLFFCAVCLIFLVYSMLTTFSLLTCLSLISIFAVCLANAFKFSFRAFQIKHRKLCSVKDFINKKEFLPTLN